MPLPSVESINDAHNRWLAQADWLAGPQAVPLLDEALLLRGGTADGLIGSWRITFTNPAEPFSLWVPDVLETLIWRSTAPPTAVSFGALLDAWLDGREPTPALLGVTVPALATGLIRALVARGFTPRTASVARLVATPAPPTSAACRVGPPRPGDREAMLDLLLELHHTELDFAATQDRPQAREHLAVYLDEALGRPDWTWVARRDDEPVGLLTLNPPEESTWAAPLVSRAPVCYLGLAAVTRRARRGGIGAALVEAAMRRAAQAGCEVVVLDHAALSPLSATFWHRRGFRPVWTRWARDLGAAANTVS